MKYMTPVEIADELRVSPRKVYAWIEANQLPALNVASPQSKLPHYRCTEDDVKHLKKLLSVVPETKPKSRRGRRKIQATYFK